MDMGAMQSPRLVDDFSFQLMRRGSCRPGIIQEEVPRIETLTDEGGVLGCHRTVQLDHRRLLLFVERLLYDDVKVDISSRRALWECPAAEEIHTKQLLPQHGAETIKEVGA
jgi:hypothetical protein